VKFKNYLGEQINEVEPCRIVGKTVWDIRVMVADAINKPPKDVMLTSMDMDPYCVWPDQRADGGRKKMVTFEAGECEEITVLVKGDPVEMVHGLQHRDDPNFPEDIAITTTMNEPIADYLEKVSAASNIEIGNLCVMYGCRALHELPGVLADASSVSASRGLTWWDLDMILPFGFTEVQIYTRAAGPRDLTITVNGQLGADNRYQCAHFVLQVGYDWLVVDLYTAIERWYSEHHPDLITDTGLVSYCDEF
jgi:hypothetical protein